MAKKGSVTGFIKGVYNDDYKWALFKSVGFFIIGIKIAYEFRGVELLTAPTP